MLWQFSGDAPIYSQLIEQIKVGIVSGVFPPGERDGLVYSQRTAGRFVTEDKAMIETAKRALAERHITAFLDAMTRLGYRREEVISMLRQEIAEGGNGDVSVAV